MAGPSRRTRSSWISWGRAVYGASLNPLREIRQATSARRGARAGCEQYRRRPIGRDLGRARNDQLARAIDAPGPAAVRKVEQAPRGIGDLFVDMNRCTRTFSFDMAEKSRRDQTTRSATRQASPFALRRLAKRGGTAPREMRFDLGIIEIGAGTRQCLAHLLTKPAIVSLAVAHELERKHPFVGRARQQDPHGVGYRETHVFQNRGGLFLHVRIDAGLDEGIRSHSDLLRSPLM